MQLWSGTIAGTRQCSANATYWTHLLQQPTVCCGLAARPQSTSYVHATAAV